MKAAVSDFVQTQRLAQQMDEHGLDAIVARAGINFTYLSGLVYPGTLARHLDLADSPRGVYLVWPRTGEPRMVVNAIADGAQFRDCRRCVVAGHHVFALQMTGRARHDLRPEMRQAL